MRNLRNKGTPSREWAYWLVQGLQDFFHIRQRLSAVGDIISIDSNKLSSDCVSTLIRLGTDLRSVCKLKREFIRNKINSIMGGPGRRPQARRHIFDSILTYESCSHSFRPSLSLVRAHT